MNFSLFGIEIKRQEKEPISFSPKQTDDGAVVVAGGGAYGTIIDLDGSIRNEAELINKYRGMADYPEVDLAIDDIVNELVVQEDNEKIVELILDQLPYSDKVKKIIITEFQNILNLLEFNFSSYDIARRWYVDGRIYYHAIIDQTTPAKGIVELRFIDPRKIRKIRELKRRKSTTELPDSQTALEYYIYNEKGFAITNAQVQSQAAQGVKIAKDSIIYTPSGLLSNNSDMVLSYLNKAIRPLNNLRSMEDSLIIYRISRAPERRIFYVDTGTLPPRKAEEYVKSLMTKFKNRLIYDSNTGQVMDDRRNASIMEDFWLPRREGGRGTEITTLPGGQNLGQIDDILYFQKKLYKALNVPIGRLESEDGFSFGRATEISRDEVKFAKFITKLRSKFTNLFTDSLGLQLILKGVVTADEWHQVKNLIKYKFAKDNYFSELKDSEILKDRLDAMARAEQFIGKALSWEWCRRHIMQQTDGDIKEIDGQIKKEIKIPRLVPLELQQAMMPPEAPGDGEQPPEQQPQEQQPQKQQIEG